MAFNKLLLIIISISLILGQGTNTTEKKVESKEEKPKTDKVVNEEIKMETKETKKNNEDIKATEEKKPNEETKETDDIEIIDDKKDTENFHQEEEKMNRTSSHKQQRRDFQSKIPFNMTTNEMDTIIVCAFIVQETMRGMKTEMEELEKKMNTTLNGVYERVGTDIFKKCNLKIDIKTVNKYVKNLTYFNNFQLDETLDEFSKIDFDNYTNETDLSLTMEDQILLYKYQKVDELFRQKKADQRDLDDNNEDYERGKLKIGKLDVDNIPQSMKIIFFLVILITFFGGMFYLLKKLEKKPKDKKKKDKKKKNQ